MAVSIDPQETPELAGRKKAAYLERYGRPGTEQGWHFLVGDRASIDDLCQTVGFRYQYNPETNLYAHAAGIVVVTPGGRVSRYFTGSSIPPKEVGKRSAAAPPARIWVHRSADSCCSVMTTTRPPAGTRSRSFGSCEFSAP